jgi:hypothetical protein
MQALTIVMKHTHTISTMQAVRIIDTNPMMELYMHG